MSNAIVCLHCQIYYYYIMEEELSIEERIVEAAKEVFVQRGFAAATMAEVARQAGLSRTAVNYYFRSKDRLFEAIFEQIILMLIPRIQPIMTPSSSVVDKIDGLIDVYTDMLLANPYLPRFVLTEIYRDPDHLIEVIRSLFSRYMPLDTIMIQTFKRAIEQGDILPVSLPDVATTFLGMVVFPIVTKPFHVRLFFDHSEQEFDRYILERKSLVKRVMYNLLIPKKQIL